MTLNELNWEDETTWPPNGTFVLMRARNHWYIGQGWHGSITLTDEVDARRGEPLWWQSLPEVP